MHQEYSGQKSYSAGATDFSTAGASSVAAQFYLVKLSSGNLALAGATSDQIIGVLQDAHRPNEVGTVRLLSAQGTMNVVAGAAISAGALLTTDSAGRAVTATQTTGGSQPAVVVIGRALEAASGAGQIIEVLPLDFLY